MSDEGARRRRLGDLEVEVDPDLCVGFADCIDEAPGAFRLDEEGIAVVAEGEGETREAILRACRACPVDAITVRDSEGRHVAP